MAKTKTSKITIDPPENAPPFNAPPSPKGKLGVMVQLLSRPDGARLDELVAATGWQAHSVRGAMSGALKKKQGRAIVSEPSDAGRIYRIVEGAGA